MEYTVKQLAELSGVSARALRYYDNIGLLHPARTTEAGYRIYGAREVDLLQQILLYRALGLPLETIRQIVYDPGFDRLSALTEQRARLETRRLELHRLIETVERTIEQEKGGIPMKDTEKFAGLKREKLMENERLYGAEARKKYGEAAVDAQSRRFSELSEWEYTDMESVGEALLCGLEEAVQSGAAPTGETGQKLAALHRRWLCFTMPDCTGEMQRGLCEMYLCDPRFTAYYDRKLTGCARFLRDAVAAYKA